MRCFGVASRGRAYAAVLAFAYSDYVGCVEWLTRVHHIVHRYGASLAAVALANKIARTAWAVMVRGEHFKEPKLLPARG